VSRFLGRVLHRFDDVLVSSAPAQIAFQPVANLFPRGISISIEQLRRSHDHARRAVTTLQSMSLPETFLHRMQFAILRKSLDRRD
jgi:hypothetical protein